MKQYLGKKKIKRIEKALNCKVNFAFTRGGWPHYTAQVFTDNGVVWFNYKTDCIVDTPLLWKVVEQFIENVGGKVIK